MSWQAAQWALTEAVMPKSDPTGRLVLAYLGAKADKEGRNAFPLAVSIAHALDLNPEVVPRVLKRLCGYGLISKDGVGPQGQPRWVLHVHKRRGEESFDEFCERHRGKRSERQARWRDKSDVDDSRSSTVDDSESSTVDDSRSSQRPDVDDSRSSRRRLSVVLKTIEDRLVDDSESPRKSPYKSPKVLYKDPYPAPAARAASDPADGELDLGIEPAAPTTRVDPLDEPFQRWWSAYPKKRKLQDARRVFVKTVKAGHDPAFLIAEAERWRDLWAAAGYVGKERQFIPDPTTWLNQKRWTDEPPASRAGAGSGGWQPYQDPVDQSVYDEAF
ncbi:hypothetical protein ABZ863_01780 [Saccharomonospora sp. NPDC046836]|uniref:hypothetical protein n=1 Tax=Saccharomonospora sp. NPDC046836 TaxID=3156921 RepID=UPI0033E2B202